MKRNLAVLFLSAMFATGLWNCGTSEAAVIYEDDFNGSGSVSLNGQTPDTAPGGEVWTLNNSTALDGWKADGTVVPTGGGIDGQTSIQLPFVPQTGQIYELSGRISLNTSASGQWVALGFSDALTNADGESGLYAFGTINGIAWVLHGDPSSNALQAFGGPDTANLAANTFSVNPTDVRVVLDTTAALWKAEYFVTSANLNSGNELLVGTTNYTSNPTIAAVGFSKGQDVGGFIDSFKLESQVVIPEPNSALLALLLLPAAATSRRRW